MSIKNHAMQALTITNYKLNIFVRQEGELTSWIIPHIDVITFNTKLKPELLQVKNIRILNLNTKS